MLDFRGKVSVVTGAASGIGKATAEYFHGAGACVVLADLNGDALKVLAAERDPTGERLATLQYDAGNPESAAETIGLAMKRFGRVDHVITSAAIYERQHVAGMTDQQWRRMMSINLDGVFYITRRAISVMADGGAIVMLASTAAHQGGSYEHAHYGATKGAVAAYARGLARDVAPKIRVNVVSPGTTETPMTAELLALRGDEYRARSPVGRLGQPSEIASVIAFLCSEGASYITGETVIVSGGIYMG